MRPCNRPPPPAGPVQDRVCPQPHGPREDERSSRKNACESRWRRASRSGRSSRTGWSTSTVRGRTDVLPCRRPAGTYRSNPLPGEVPIPFRDTLHGPAPGDPSKHAREVFPISLEELPAPGRQHVVMGRVGLDPSRITSVPRSLPTNSMTTGSGRTWTEKRVAMTSPGSMTAMVYGTCTHLRRVQEENNVRTEEPERHGHVLGQQARENDHDPRKAQPVYLPRRLYSETRSTGESSSPIPTTAMRRAPPGCAPGGARISARPRGVSRDSLLAGRPGNRENAPEVNCIGRAVPLAEPAADARVQCDPRLLLPHHRLPPELDLAGAIHHGDRRRRADQGALRAADAPVVVTLHPPGNPRGSAPSPPGSGSSKASRRGSAASRTEPSCARPPCIDDQRDRHLGEGGRGDVAFQPEYVRLVSLIGPWLTRRIVASTRRMASVLARKRRNPTAHPERAA